MKKVKILIFIACLIIATSNPCLAVVITAGSGNTSAPADDPGWDYVGARGGATCVYLGNNWVLTANHVGPGNIVLGTTTYTWVQGSQVRLKNPDNSYADLIKFQIYNGPDWPLLSIKDTAPDIGAEVVMIGRGRPQQSTMTYWDENWNEVTPPGTYFGYKTNSGNIKRWGTNEIVENNYYASGYGWTFVTEFNYDEDKPNEAQGISGDSGGAVFIKDAWYLAGIMGLVSLWEGQSLNNAVYGTYTLSYDLSRYRDQIVPIPEPATITMFSYGAIGIFWLLKRRCRPL